MVSFTRFPNNGREIRKRDVLLDNFALHLALTVTGVHSLGPLPESPIRVNTGDGAGHQSGEPRFISGSLPLPSLDALHHPNGVGHRHHVKDHVKAVAQLPQDLQVAQDLIFVVKDIQSAGTRFQFVVQLGGGAKVLHKLPYPKDLAREAKLRFHRIERDQARVRMIGPVQIPRVKSGKIL